MKKVGFAFDETCLRHLPPIWHPEAPERIRHIAAVLDAAGLLKNLLALATRKAGIVDLIRVHAPAYIEAIRNHGPGELDPDTYLSEESFDAALHASGAVMEAIDQCRSNRIERAFCAIRPPGHHAEPDRGMGFCLFNNIAIGARYARSIGYERVFIVDFDAHHGNGTQAVFEQDDTVFYFSTHQHPYYPDTGKDEERGTGRGLGFTYNVPILAGSGNRDYLMVYQDILPGVVRRFNPDLMLVSAGYDIHVHDPHANIRVTDEGIHGIVRAVLDSCEPCPTVFVLEGGYDLASLGESVRITIEEMLK